MNQPLSRLYSHSQTIALCDYLIASTLIQIVNIIMALKCAFVRNYPFKRVYTDHGR